jgi:hypothetical protein
VNDAIFMKPNLFIVEGIRAYVKLSALTPAFFDQGTDFLQRNFTPFAV